MTTTRRLAAILAADVAGYSRLMGADEEGTLRRLRAIRDELGCATIATCQGRLMKTTGTGRLSRAAGMRMRWMVRRRQRDARSLTA